MEPRELTQSDLARASGVSQGQVSRILAGDGRPRRATLDRLARVLGVSLEVLRGSVPLPKSTQAARRDDVVAAIREIARAGFTDVLPEPIERRLFVDIEDNVVEELLRLDRLFAPDVGAVHPRLTRPSVARVAAPKERHGLRWVSQIDPLYDAYGLALVHAVAPDIEASRLPVEQGAVHSYRWDPDDDGLWREAGMKDFIEMSRDRSRETGWVVTTDIASFYDRVPVGVVSRLLGEVCSEPDAGQRIARLFEAYAGDIQVGLPIGGPAARLLAELFLAPIDELLDLEGIPFNRYVDDYHLFADSEVEAYRALVFLSDALHGAGALTLQTGKTRIQDSETFLKSLKRRFGDDLDDEDESTLTFDMYGEPSGEGDMLEWGPDEAEEYFEDALRHDDSRARRALGRLPWLTNSRGGLDAAVRVVVERISEPEMRMLVPHALRRLSSEVAHLSEEQQKELTDQIEQLVQSDSPVILPEQAAVYAVDVLSKAPNPSTRKTLLTLARRSKGDLLKSHVTVALARMGQNVWVQRELQEFDACGPWQRRALIAASHGGGRGGRQWREVHRVHFESLELLVDEWASEHWA